ncbi:MAG: cyclic nucleotide-binding domain-containing protein [Elusimicrobia bacterium]|nr:cyclic nucleotide-binding domain-containing protein [Elusimicrobiota bacterium]
MTNDGKSGVIEARPVVDKEIEWLQQGMRNVGFFSKLGRSQLTEVLPYMLLIQYAEGSVICSEGEAGDAMYLIYRGKVVITKKDWKDPVAVLEDGDFVGEMALLFGEPRSATVTTACLTEVFCLAAEDFKRIVDRSPDMTRTLRRLAEARRSQLAKS